MSQVRLRVFFVDDETRVLQGLQRMLRPLRDQWDMVFIEGGEAALIAMASNPADVIVSDMRMPIMSGAQLLTQIMHLYPATVRLILSGQADLQLIHSTIGPVHQYLAKPCDAELLRSTIERAAHVREALDGHLRSLVGGIDNLPCLPAAHQALVNGLKAGTAGRTAVRTAVASDLGMSMKVLQLMNSAFFGSPRSVCQIEEAVDLLGIETMQVLAGPLAAFKPVDDVQFSGFPAEGLWNHARQVADLSARIAQGDGATPVEIDVARTAGLLHDVGNLVLAIVLTDRRNEFYTLLAYPEAQAEERDRLLLGTSHAEVGAYLMSLWGLPPQIVDAVAGHHLAELDATASIATRAVRAADALLHHLAESRDDADPELARLGPPAQIPAWLALARTVATTLPGSQK